MQVFFHFTHKKGPDKRPTLLQSNRSLRAGNYSSPPAITDIIAMNTAMISDSLPS